MQKMNVKSKHKKELLAIITQPQNRYQRIWLACATLIFSILALFVSWWFWRTVIQSDDRPRFDLIRYAAVTTLTISSYVGMVSSALIVARRPIAARLFNSATAAGLVSFGVVIISTVIEVIRRGNFDWLYDIGEAFRDFSVLDVGPLSISIPTVITVAIIACIIATDMLRKK